MDNFLPTELPQVNARLDFGTHIKGTEKSYSLAELSFLGMPMCVYIQYIHTETMPIRSYAGYR